MAIVADTTSAIRRLAAQAWWRGLQACHSGTRLRTRLSVVPAMRRPFPAPATQQRMTRGLSQARTALAGWKGLVSVTSR
jgi:hypothetical protein